ncbi:MAG: type I restriction endonuclease, partial [Petrotogales bacterium]
MSFSEEKSVEEPAVEIFESLGYDAVNLFHELFGADNDLGRENRSEVILKNVLMRKLFELNSGLSEEVIESAILELERDRSSLSLVRANHEVYQLLKDGIKVPVVEDGEERIEIVRVIDWDEPENNDFLLASQMWIAGDLYTRRPDLIGFVNGLPLILFELKKFTVNVKHAYDDNLSDYKDTIPQLFWYNAFVILSNGLETLVGPFSAPWEHFNEWTRLSEDEEIQDSFDQYLKRSRE